MKTFAQFLENKVINFDMDGQTRPITLGSGLEDGTKKVVVPVNSLPHAVATAIIAASVKNYGPDATIIKVIKFTPPFDMRFQDIEAMHGRGPKQNDIIEYEVTISYNQGKWEAIYGVDINGRISIWSD